MKTMKMTRGGVLRFLLCVFVAFIIWLFVMYTESPEYEKEYSEIKVELRNYSVPYEYDISFPDTIDAAFRGTNVNLAACNSEDIIAVVDLNNATLSGVNVYTYPVSFEFKGNTKLTPLTDSYVNIACKSAELVTHRFKDVSVAVRTADTPLAGYTASVGRVSEVTLRGRVGDIRALQQNGVYAYILPTTENVNTIVMGCQEGQPYTLAMKVQFDIKREISVIGAGNEPMEIMVNVTFTPPAYSTSDKSETIVPEEGALPDSETSDITDDTGTGIAE